MRYFQIILALIVVVLAAENLFAQAGATNSSVYVGKRPAASLRNTRSTTTQRYSWIDIEQPEPREIKLHDLVTILVDEKAQERFDNQFDRTRKASLQASLNEFIRIGDSGNLENAADNQPTIDGQVNGKFNANAGSSSQEGVQYRITVRVVEVKDNGQLVIEGRKTIRSNRDVFVYTLSGVIDSRSVENSGNILKANSEHVYHLEISKTLNGKINESVRRPWGVVLYDKFFPF